MDNNTNTEKMSMNKNMLIGGALIVLVLGIGGFLLMQNNSEDETKETKTTSNQMEEKEETMENKTIVDVAVENGNFTTLAKALTAAGLVETLSGEGPFTVFAPTDEAFAKLPAGTLDSLLADKEALTKVLTYHVVSGKVLAADVVNLTSAKTLQGQDVTVKVEGSKVMVNDANVTQTDVMGSNGVIHVIDTVLLPK